MTEDPLKSIIENLKRRIEAFENSVAASIEKYESDLHTLMRIVTRIEESWSGSWIGYHASLYYKGYEEPSRDEIFDSEWGSVHGISEAWEERSFDDISTFIHANPEGKNIFKMKDFISQHVKNARNLQLDLCIELSPIRSFQNFEQETEILDRIENIRWGISSTKFVQYWMPKQYGTRDKLAISQGIRIPPHIRYKAEILHLSSIISDLRDFINLSKRLIRQIGFRMSISQQMVKRKEGDISFEYDVFICHASEDKESFVRKLAERLVDKGLRVWYDEFTLLLGDSLRSKIDLGLKKSRFGVVVLSKNFFAKEWPQRELDGLVAREGNGEKVILPVWHGITKKEVQSFSPILAGRRAVSSDKGLDYVVSEILKVFDPVTERS